LKSDQSDISRISNSWTYSSSQQRIKYFFSEIKTSFFDFFDFILDSLIHSKSNTTINKLSQDGWIKTLVQAWISLIYTCNAISLDDLSSDSKRVQIYDCLAGWLSFVLNEDLYGIDGLNGCWSDASGEWSDQERLYVAPNWSLCHKYQIL